MRLHFGWRVKGKTLDPGGRVSFLVGKDDKKIYGFKWVVLVFEIILKDLDEKKKGKNLFINIFVFGLISHHQTTSGTTQNLDNYPKRIFLCKAKIQKRPASPAHSPACLTNSNCGTKSTGHGGLFAL